MKTKKRAVVLVVALWAVLGGVAYKQVSDARAEERAEQHRPLVANIKAQASLVQIPIWLDMRGQRRPGNY